MKKRNQQIRAETTDDLDDDVSEAGGSAFQVFTTSKVIKEHSIYVSRDVGEAFEYDEISHLLRQASEKDEVKIYLNTPGGDVFAGLSLIQAMRDSKATITTILNTQAFSMGALMFLCGDIRIAPPNSLLMFHHYSGGLSGKGNEQVAELSATSTWFKEAMQDTCANFLTNKEIREILDGRDLWLRNPEINRRLQHLKKATKKVTSLKGNLAAT